MEIIGFIRGIIAVISTLVVAVKGLFEIKKLAEKTTMPDIKSEDKIAEIMDKKELARNLVALAGIEAAYNIARGLVTTLTFAVLFHYANKLTALFSRFYTD
jgi:uncharacterized protein YqhQ